MSAFILGKKHIDTLLTAACWLKAHDHLGGILLRNGEYITQFNASEVGQLLVDENYRSVNYRYDTHEEPYEYTFSWREDVLPVTDREIAAMLKAIHCYDYQTCENPGWQESFAHTFCEQLESSLIHNLSGYDQAPWDVGD